MTQNKTNVINLTKLDPERGQQNKTELINDT